jgi:hypothetical protein
MQTEFYFTHKYVGSAGWFAYAYVVIWCWIFIISICIRVSAEPNMYGWTSSSKEQIIVAYWTKFFVLSTFKGPCGTGAQSTHREATAAFWRIFHHDGKISPAWWGWGVHAHPLSLYLPSRTKLQCTLQLSGHVQCTHSPYFISINICTLWCGVMSSYSLTVVHTQETVAPPSRIHNKTSTPTTSLPQLPSADTNTESKLGRKNKDHA